ncbi:sugar ABC transporter ATP-binding protein [Diplocloster agilis]|uniref:sugar ABC transporter ATP-binding protein n=1 Tax=Diplocloster agilis TaxID=2850323 RepID=UPI0008207EB6|nr:sugar ABC transporter ATP-binding protein [Suonthocola fibrivorans]MCU6735826.1 sugar ABC transporter ATP-binding protein [Suonthocola fibrivorans]SCJ82477.1 Ribose import ATP-binding protein RbsA [uncultured Clostridium sp.]
MGEHTDYIVEMKNCRKVFPGVVAVNDVSLSLRRGEVHALIGENGAGKSTIMKILAGILPLDGGEILYEGEPFSPKNPLQVLEKGISMIPQELDLVPDMSVWENIYCGQEKTTKLGVINKKVMIAETQKIFDELGIQISPLSKIYKLSVAQMQMVTIVKAIAFDADVIIMDEPTSAITDREVAHLFEVIAKLKNQQKAIVYISHKMDEIFQIADMITVMRDGCHIVTKKASELTREEVIHHMVGRDLSNMYTKDGARTEEFDPEEVLLEVNGLSKEGQFEDISFDLKRGEILGVSGLMGAGRTEVMETIFGLRKADKGTIRIKGRDVRVKNPGIAIRRGLAFVSEDRKLYGLNLSGTIKTNITMAYLSQILLGRLIIQFKKERFVVDDLMGQLKVKATSRETVVNNLSGGNQQKVIIAKWLMGEPDIFIMDEPTRGIDIGAKAEIYKIMDTLAKRGKSIIMISSEMPELLGMSDRVIVMHEGRITGKFTREECNQEILMTCSVGGNVDGN